MRSTDTHATSSAPPVRRSRFAAIRDELRHRPLAYAAAAAFCVVGPLLARIIFPEAPLALVIFGGVLFGLHFAFCALANKFFE